MVIVTRLSYMGEKSTTFCIIFMFIQYSIAVSIYDFSWIAFYDYLFYVYVAYYHVSFKHDTPQCCRETFGWPAVTKFQLYRRLSLFFHLMLFQKYGIIIWKTKWRFKQNQYINSSNNNTNGIEENNGEWQQSFLVGRYEQIWF